MRGICLLAIGIVLNILSVGTSNAQTQPDFLVAEVSNPTPYVGETLIYTVQWFSDLDAPTLEGAEFVRPDYAGFGLGDETVENNTTRIDNRRYNVLTIRTAITPLIPGILMLSPFQLVVPGSPFQEQLSIASEALTLNVSPLPADAPSTYVNAIGSFNAELTTSSTIVTTGEPITLELTVTGSGNLPQMLPPLYEAGLNWQILDTDSELEMRGLLIGTRVFRWTLIPLRPDPPPLPPVQFAAFVPDTATYTVQTLTASSVTVTGEPLDIQPVINPPDEEGSANTISWRPLMGTDQSTQVPAPSWFLWLIPPLAVPVFRFQSRLRAKAIRGQNRSLKSNRRLLEQLRTLSVEDPKHAHKHIAAIARSYRTQYVAKDPDHSFLNRLDEIIHLADEGRYGPVTSEDVEVLCKQLAQLIQETSRL